MNDNFKLDVVVRADNNAGLLYHIYLYNIRPEDLTTSIIFITDHVAGLYEIRVTRE